jgi:hypothetical protein
VKPLTVCIGYDSREPIALEVCAHSLTRRASGPLSIIPLALNHLKGIYTRAPNGTTEFSLTRFLTPYLSNYEGVSVFMDCDMIALTDIYDVLDLARGAVAVCPHDYAPREGLKATGVQTTYPRKNWSSFMVFDNAKCRTLTLEYVNSASPADLHRLVWANESIGYLPLEWNWLVGEYDPCPDPKVLHYTLGTPCFSAYKDCDHAQEWWDEYAHMNQPIEHWIQRKPFAVAGAAGYPVPPRTF